MSPSHCGAVCLLLLLGAAVSSGNPIHSVESVAELLSLNEVKIGSEPLFTSVIRNINTTCQRKEDIQLMNATLDVYIRIFSSILHHHNSHGHAPSLLDQLSAADRHQVRALVRELQHKMEALRTRLNWRNHDNEKMLSQLNQIKVDDPTNQRKALAEIQLVYNAASLIGSPVL